MCLTIDLKKHPVIQPIFLAKDLEVVKYLTSYKKSKIGVKIYRTPYMQKRVYFIFGRAYLFAKIDCSGLQCTTGIHACLTREDEERPGEPFKAIIPKGTKVYYGDDNDIVAEKMIIYKHKS